MMKKNKLTILVSGVASLALLLSACALALEPAQGTPPTPVVQMADAPLGLQEVSVAGISVEIGVGSPIPVDAVISGTWPGLCSQFAEIKQEEGERKFNIHLFATPDQPSCPPDHVGLPFRIAVPLNMVEKPAGTYIVSANGMETSFEWNATAVDGNSSDERFVFENVSFVLDPTFAASASGQHVSKPPNWEDGPFWESHPEYVRISLDGYPLSQTTLQPVIALYPVSDYRQMSDQVGKILDNLGDILVIKPTDEQQMPLLPLMNAAQVFHSNVKYINFQNGSGVRYLAVLAQYPAPVNNQDLFYTYQGLTSDGRYLVSIILPVSQSSLPMSANALPLSELEAIAKDPAYYGDMAGKLNALADGDFAPDLAKMDALVASLAIEQ